MLRSLFAGISGLNAHQTMLDVVGNNIANVNTVGYKSQSVLFEDTLSQEIQSAGSPQAAGGGTNPIQVGLGVRLGTIATNWSQGATELTNKDTDLAIQGDGLFAVQQGNLTYYTRNGSFSLDAGGSLVDANGDRVLGWAANNGVVNTNASVQPLKLAQGKLLAPVQTTSVTMAGNLPAGAPAGTSITTSIDGYDSQGNTVPLTIVYGNPTTDASGATTWSVNVSDSSGQLTGSSSVKFDQNGKLTTGSPLSVGLTNSGAASWTPTSLSLDLSAVTQFGSSNSIGATAQDGSAAGSLQSFTIGTDGTITGVFSNGLKQSLGQIAIASFTNEGGLEKVGDSLYATTVNSGNAVLGTAGSGGRGTLAGGTLEMSNVNLAQEFANLIIAQRGFEANSKVITTSDQVLGDLVQLKQ